MLTKSKVALKGQKLLILKAFALSGRLFCICFKTQGDALG
jgi:hypothetical protein